MQVSLGFVFFAGLASFLSPCVFALVPAYVGYLSGRSAASAAGEEDRSSSWHTFTHGLAFVLGFSVVFVILGALAGLLGRALHDIEQYLTIIGGVIVIIFGIHMTHLIRIPFLEYDLRPQSQPDRNRGYISSALMGVFFSAGWSPCIGPILGAVLTFVLSGGSVGEGALYLAAYSAGLAIPFLLAATQIGWVTTVLRKYNKVMHYTEIVMGVLLIALGVLLLTGRIATLAGLGSFVETANEVALGKLLFASLGASGVLGLIPALIARSKEKNFLDWWFLGSGIFLVICIVVLLLVDFQAALALFS
jgi:cytochrome c-type biogenesis protein